MLSEIENRLLESITFENWLGLTRELVVAGQPDSENPLDPDIKSGSEEAIARCVGEKLSEFGLSVNFHAKQSGRPNVIAEFIGSGEGPTIIINDHLDTYPAGDPAKWSATGGNPYNPTLTGHKLYSRGTSDTRGNLACTLLAIKALKEISSDIKGTLKCVYTVDEEKHGPNGAIYLIDELGLTADYEITCEPTGWTRTAEDWGMGIAIAHSGNFLVEIETIGVQSHLWRPDTGVNPITLMLELLRAIEKMNFSHMPPNLYGGTKPSACLLRIGGGLPKELQFTPEKCQAIFAVVGIVPGMTAETILQDIANVIESIARSGARGTVSLRQLPNSLFVAATEELDTTSVLVSSIANAYQDVLGKKPTFYRKNAYCDTIRFSHSGIPSITFGPGEDGWPPMNEYIDISKALPAARILALTLLRLLNTKTK